jgi:arsenate reductase (thioredoxin)
MIHDLYQTMMLAAAILCTVSAAERGDTGMLNGRLRKYLDDRKAEFNQIPFERKEALQQVSQYVRRSVAAGEQARLTFICTHNSRRSHMGQLWAAASAAYYEVGNVETFSGGTEATAFNPRAVAALERAGFEIEKGTEKQNPRYRVRLLSQGPDQVCFSKVYYADPNPKKDYCAVMTCAQADKNCPMVRGASLRVSIPYEDPKSADGTPVETATYDERCAQIARETLYIFSLVKD